MAEKTKLRVLTLILGLSYVALIGFFRIGTNFQATLFYLSIFASIWFLTRRRNIRLSKFHTLILILGLLLAVFFSITTNKLVVGVTYLASSFFVIFLLLLIFEKETPRGPLEFVKSFLRYIKYLIISFLSFTSAKKYFTIKKVKLEVAFNKNITYGLLLSLVLITIFHILFAQVNSDYAAFMARLLNRVWETIKYVLNIEVLWIIFKGIIEAYLLYILLSVEHTKESDALLAKNWPLVIFKISLVSVIILFLMFSSFQSQQLFMNLLTMSFKDVSQYVQKGFLELLFITIVGYLLAIFVLQRVPKEPSRDRAHIRLLLTFFAIELIAITIFIFHKLYALQAVFGFKDQRLVASGAVLLIFITFGFLLFRIWNKLSSDQIFRWQILLFGGLVFLFNLVKIDLFVTRYNPIRYYSAGLSQKDFSYLLGNSFDNVTEWERLMTEAKVVGIPTPDVTYYWGHFSAGRTDFYGSPYSPICEKIETYEWEVNPNAPRTIKKFTFNTYLEKRYRELDQKYKSLSLTSPLPHLTNININEYMAYRFIQQNQGQIESFLEFAKTRCGVLL